MITDNNINLTEHIKQIFAVIIGAGIGIAGYVLLEKLVLPDNN